MHLTILVISGSNTDGFRVISHFIMYQKDEEKQMEFEKINNIIRQWQEMTHTVFELKKLLGE